jgi:excisionase family DNA binding protein
MHYHPESIRRLVRSGVLSSVRIGRRVRVPLQEVERYEQHRVFSGSVLPSANQIHWLVGGFPIAFF